MPRNDKIPAPAAPPATFDFKTLWHVLVERFWIILLCLVVGVVSAIAYIQRAPVLYAATSTVRVDPEELRVLKIEKVAADESRTLDALRTIEQSLKSRTLLERVAQANQLAKDTSFWGSAAEPSVQQIALVLDTIATARLRRGTRFIDVTVTHPNPDMTARLANSIVNEYLAQAFEQNTNAAGEASSFLVTEARRLKTELEKAENALQQFRKDTKTVSVEERSDIVGARLRELNARVTGANAETIRYRADMAQVNQAGTNVAALMVLAPVNADLAVVEARSTLSRLESEFASLRQRYKEAHPKYIEKANQIAEWQNTLTNAVRKVPHRLQATYEASMAAEKALQDELNKQQDLARQLTEEVVKFQRLARDVDANRALYETVQQRLKETTLTRELRPSRVHLQDNAIVNRTPVAPNKRSIFVKAVLAGLFGGLLLALGVNAIDSSIKTVDQAEESLRLPVLSAVPQLKAGESVVVKENANSPGAEAFRTLRTSLTMLGRAEQRRTFLFTSALPGEGKTFCSVNYAVCLAQQGLRTLLIDADLRRPAVHKVLRGQTFAACGVTDYLTGQKQLDEVIQAHEQEKFFFIPAGSVAPNPAELLAQNGLEALIDEALLKFDRVVVDSAPIHAVSDTLLMLNRIQTVCLVVRTGKTPRRAVVRAIELLHKAEAPLAGTILNRQPRRRLGRYYYDPYYSYAYEGKYSDKGVYGSK
jgi:capsular exopolysaccharide synthesis family protein